MESTNCSSFFSIPHCLHCMTNDLNLEKNCCTVSKLLGCSTTESFSTIWPLSSSCFPNKDSSLSHTSFGVLNPSGWNNNSLDMWMHMKPKASSNLFKNLDFSTYYWGSNSLPIFILKIPLLHKVICISTLQ